ncbi:MAG TPA: DUF1223 domain-containing protein [Vicinamibacterales bacterium]|nr:DUF1223 domain-containing protein [Vicinamibacterales bacterium]
MSPLTVAGVLGSVAAVGLTAAAVLRQPPPLTPASADRTPVIVELFTSEGCSSCPPADAVLSDLVSAQPVGHALVIGLSEHVDYWDNLGWKDPFSNHKFTERQSAYAAAANEADIYTPEMVVDGSAAFVGSDRQAALSEISRAASHGKSTLRAVWANGAPRALIVDAPEGSVPSNASVVLAIVEDHLTSSVTRGENKGHQLSHTAVTRSLATLGAVAKDGSFHTSAKIDTLPGWNLTALHAVVFVQLEHFGRILAAASVPFGS